MPMSTTNKQSVLHADRIFRVGCEDLTQPSQGQRSTFIMTLANLDLNFQQGFAKP